MNKPSIAPYQRHVLMCCGKACGEQLPLLKGLKKKVKEVGLDGEVRVNRAGCLGVCEQGPIMVVHPEGVWYYDLTKEKLERIVDEHFKQGKPVKDFVFYGL